MEGHWQGKSLSPHQLRFLGSLALLWLYSEAIIGFFKEQESERAIALYLPVVLLLAILSTTFSNLFLGIDSTSHN